jgi:hypothetical protein
MIFEKSDQINILPYLYSCVSVNIVHKSVSYFCGAARQCVMTTRLEAVLTVINGIQRDERSGNVFCCVLVRGRNGASEQSIARR